MTSPKSHEDGLGQVGELRDQYWNASFVSGEGLSI